MFSCSNPAFGLLYEINQSINRKWALQWWWRLLLDTVVRKGGAGRPGHAPRAPREGTLRSSTDPERVDFVDVEIADDVGRRGSLVHVLEVGSVGVEITDRTVAILQIESVQVQTAVVLHLTYLTKQDGCPLYKNDSNENGWKINFRIIIKNNNYIIHSGTHKIKDNRINK